MRPAVVLGAIRDEAKSFPTVWIDPGVMPFLHWINSAQMKKNAATAAPKCAQSAGGTAGRTHGLLRIQLRKGLAGLKNLPGRRENKNRNGLRDLLY